MTTDTTDALTAQRVQILWDRQEAGRHHRERSTT